MKIKEALLACLLLANTYFSYAIEPDDIKISIAKYKGDKKCAISYTFDDGFKEHYTQAAPELEKRGFRGTFWINGFRINGDVTVDTTWMNWSELKEMAERGHEISNHSWSHPNLKRINSQEVIREIKKNDSIIFEHTGILPRTFCYPYNSFNDTILHLASIDRIATRTKQTSLGSKATPENLVKRTERNCETGEWDVAMIHGISYGYDSFPSPQIFWDHLDKVKAMEDKIWVGTFREVASYTKERNNIKLDIVTDKNKLCVIPELSLDKNLFEEPLTMVLQKKGIKKITVKQDGKKLHIQSFQDKIVFDFNPFGGIIEINIKHGN